MWFLFSLVYTLLERGLLGTNTKYPATGNPYSFIDNLLITPLLSLVVGLIIGTIEAMYFNRLFSRRKLWQKLVYKSFIYLCIIVLFLVALTALANSISLHRSFFDAGVWFNVWSFFFDYMFLGVAIYMGATIFVSQFYNEVSENIGPAVLSNFFTGKYHRPTQEYRIFMFVDMKASTTIAEQIGHLRYFDLLKEYYNDLCEPIVNYQGEIYQYVGDEVVISWPLKNGLKNNNCIHCFFAMKKSLDSNILKYKTTFGAIPGFRAGLHCGEVTTGEIGALKREIIFTGDVLNTTSRILALCKHYEVDLLLSEPLLAKLPDQSNPAFNIIQLGEAALRGREERIKVATISF